MAVRRYRQPRKKRMTRKVKPRTKVDKSLSRRIRKLEKAPELKYHTYISTLTPTASGIAYSLISSIPDGDNYNERIGNQIISKRLSMQYRLIFDPQDGVASQIRCICGWDTQVNGTAPFTLFTGTSPTASDLSNALFDDRAGMPNIMAHYNENTKARYKILYDKTHTVNFKTSTMLEAIQVKKSILLNNALVQYSGTALGIDSLPTRNLFFLYFSSLTDNGPTINANFRYFFIDP